MRHPIRNYLTFASAVLLMSISSTGCGESQQKANLSPSGEPAILWKYETGG